MTGVVGRILAAAAACVALAAAGCGGSVLPGERSVILVTLDTTRADRIGVYGGPVPTPHLDRVAREGALFLQAASQVPLTLPAHSSMLTGQYPARHGVRHNGIYRLPESADTLTERLRAAGFETAAFVAAYVLNRGFGMEQGFDVYDDVAVNRFEGGRDQLFEAERTADEVNERVFAWLDGRPEGAGKYFLWVHYYDPHHPYEPPERDGRTLHGEGYDREISYVDHAFGDLLERLDRDGALEDSILVVVGDHGESLGQHDEKTHGIFIYEPAMHVPLFIRAPGLIPAGTEIDRPAELVDLAPTVLELLGLPAMDDAQGASLVARIEGADDGALELAHAESLMPRLEFGWSELYAVSDGRFKYIEAPTPELYDLVDDPGERVNLAPNDPERVAEMVALLTRWKSGNDAGGGSGGEAVREMSAEELARLQSLGYMQAGLADDDGGAGLRPDPKERIGELRALDDARDRLAEGRLEDALAGVDAILASNPHNHNARATRIAALLQLGRFREGEEEARAGLTLATTGAQASASVAQKTRGLLAGALRLQERFGDAEALYLEMNEVDPGDDGPIVDLARMYVEAGRPEDALARLGPILERSPRNGMALAARFQAEFALGRRDAMIETARRLADARAGDADTLIRVGDLLLREGDPGRAAVAFEVAQDQIDLSPDLLGKLGAARFEAGDLDGAEEVFQGLAALRPRDPRAVFFLGNVALARGDEAAARGHYDRAAGLDPRFTRGDVNLARWLASRDRVDDAREVVRRGLARAPGDARLRELAARLGANGG